MYTKSYSAEVCYVYIGLVEMLRDIIYLQALWAVFRFWHPVASPEFLQNLRVAEFGIGERAEGDYLPKNNTK